MRMLSVRQGCVGRLVTLLGLLLLLPGCSTTTPAAAVRSAPPAPPVEDDDVADLIAELSGDLTRARARESARRTAAAPASRSDARRELTARTQQMFGRLDRAVLQMPVVGVRPYDLTNSWGDARDGGKRKHRGIDIFAPRGTPVVAVVDGFISFIGEMPKGGRSIWLSTENGHSFYYAHLDRWAPGLYEGMEVRSGDLLGYVGNTGNAKTTPPHLHFAVRENDETINPYPILTRAQYVNRARVTASAGAALGTR